MSNSIRRITKRVKATIDQRVVNYFHRLWYDSPNTWRKNTYLGHRVRQLPLDLWLYQELIFRLRPAFILQTGIGNGGGLLYFAHLLDQMKADASVIIIGVDTNLSKVTIASEQHPRIHLIEGSSTAPETIAQIKHLVPSQTGGLVSLDSDHTCQHVAAELELYHPFVNVGGYLIVEDTNINGHPVYPDYGPGPYEAVQQFLKKYPNFVADDALWRRNLVSFHQYGWLKRQA